MRKVILLFLFLFSLSCQYSWADDSNDEILNAANYATGKTGTILRVPANVDVLVGVGDDSILISFYGNFGNGRYHLSNTEGDVVIDTITATEGSVEVIQFESGAEGTNTLNIEFENGKHCTLTW